MKKQKILKLEDVESVAAFQFKICQRLKMTGWQFDKLPIEEKILKWISRNPDKELILEINTNSILKNIIESKSRIIQTSRVEIPENYEMGNPLNRWIHEGPIRTEAQVIEDEKRTKKASKREFEEIEALIESIKSNCNIKIIREPR